MPHVIVKMSPGRSEDQKRRLAEAFAKDLIEIVSCKEASISVAIGYSAIIFWGGSRAVRAGAATAF